MRNYLTLALLAILTSQVAAGEYLFVSVAGEKRIAVYAVDHQTGQLTHSSTVAVAGEPGGLTTDPQRRFLFASIRSTGELASFRIAKNGSLQHLNTVTAGADPAFVATDRSGAFLLSAYYRAGKADVHRIRADGTLPSKPSMSVSTADKAHAILTDRSNRFAFVPHTGPNQIFQFRFDPTNGKLTPNAVPIINTGDNTGPRHLAMHPTLNTVYSDNEQGSSVTAFALDPDTGQLRSRQTLSTLPAGYDRPNSTARLEITPSGRFLYAANRGHDSIAGFAIDARTGSMRSLGQTPTEQTPRSFTVSPSEKYLYAAGQSSGKIAAYHIAPRTGKLDRFATYAVGRTPWWVLAVSLK